MYQTLVRFTLIFTSLFLISHIGFAQSDATPPPSEYIDVMISHEIENPEKVTVSIMMLTQNSDLAVKGFTLKPVDGSDDDPTVRYILSVEVKDRFWPSNNRGVVFDQYTSTEIEMNPMATLEVIVIYDGSFNRRKKKRLRADEQYD